MEEQFRFPEKGSKLRCHLWASDWGMTTPSPCKLGDEGRMEADIPLSSPMPFLQQSGLVTSQAFPSMSSAITHSLSRLEKASDSL